MKFFKNKKGFTLIELVVVIAILGILAGIAIPRFMDATAAARGSKIVADLRTIDSATMMYQAKEGKLPAAVAAAANNTSADLVPNYLAAFPAPPTSAASIVNNAGNTITIKKDYGVAYALTDAGRATYGGKTVDELLASTANLE